MTTIKGQKMALTASDGREVVVRLEVNPRAKRLILRQQAAAASFAASRVDWIAERLSRAAHARPLTEGAIIPLRGEPCRLSGEGEGRRARLKPGLPLTLEAPGDPATFPQRVARFLRGAARNDLAEAVARHGRTLGVSPTRITVKDTRSRWGSCTSDGRLAFSWRLVCAPPEVLDYVAAHECAHLLEMNHSSRFWAHVARCCPDWEARRAWLRTEGRSLHAIAMAD